MMPNNNPTNSTNTDGNNHQSATQVNIPPMPSSFQSGQSGISSTPGQSTQQVQQRTVPSPHPQDQTNGNKQPPPSQNQQSPKTKELEAVFTSPHVPKRLGGKKIIATIFGILFLVGGIAAGVFLAQKRQFIPSKAWNCDQYLFEVSQQGEVSVRNGQTRNEPPQQARVYIDDTLTATFDVPALESGSAATLGMVNVPSGQGFNWEVVGTIDCEDSGSYGSTTSPTPTTPQVSASCSTVKAYDDNWNSLSSSDLSVLNTGDVVRFTVSGTTTSGVIDKAKFTVNGINLGETTDKKPGTDEFYIEYTIPEGVTSFTIDAQIHHSQLGWF